METWTKIQNSISWESSYFRAVARRLGEACGHTRTLYDEWNCVDLGTHTSLVPMPTLKVGSRDFLEATIRLTCEDLLHNQI